MDHPEVHGWFLKPCYCHGLAEQKARPWGAHAIIMCFLASGLKYLEHPLLPTLVIAHNRMLRAAETENDKICVTRAAENQNLSVSIPLMNNQPLRNSQANMVSVDSVLDMNSMQCEPFDAELVAFFLVLPPSLGCTQW